YLMLPHAVGDYTLLHHLVKLPGILCDLFDGWLIYAIVLRLSTNLWACVAAGLFVLNPASIYVSAYWGQVDSVPAAFMLGALALILYAPLRAPAAARWFVIAAWLAIAYAILIKPPAVVIAILMLAWIFATSDAAVRIRRLGDSLLGVVAAVLLAYAIALVFDPNAGGAFGWLVERYRFGSAVYPFNSVNAFDLHSIFRPFWQPDTAPVVLGGMSLGPMWVWGIILVAAACVLIVARYLQRRDDEAFLEAAFLLALSFFILATRMHERYVYNAFALVIPLAVVSRRYLVGTVLLSFTFLVNLWYALYYAKAMAEKLPVNGTDIFPLITHPLSALNVVIFFALGYVYLGGKLGRWLDAPGLARPPESVTAKPSGLPARVGGWIGSTWFSPVQGLVSMTPLDWLYAGGFTLIALVLDLAWYWLPPDRYFDEIYYPRSGIEYLKGIPAKDWEYPFEWTHPPLTKLMIALSIWMFGGVAHGDNGYGWRFLNVIVGTVAIPLLYIFAKRLMASTLFASIATFMWTFEGFRFVQSRIATPEIWVATFTLFILYAFYRLWTATQIRIRAIVPAEFGWRFWVPLAAGTAVAVLLSRFVNSFGATPAQQNAYVFAFVYFEMGAYLLARWVGRRFSPAGADVISYAEGSYVVAEGSKNQLIRYDGGGPGRLKMDGLDLDYRKDGT
ncbi:MAG: phospholipid carrier-dependent glycosyltransferase, partial [Candidatus Eremiobacteraeota bacterium]|nr:phospholipid carrier-dependent glycosyltransferase [Candidatus Eremiobacteraeota bacterium]